MCANHINTYIQIHTASLHTDNRIKPDDLTDTDCNALTHPQTPSPPDRGFPRRVVSQPVSHSYFAAVRTAFASTTTAQFFRIFFFFFPSPRQFNPCEPSHTGGATFNFVAGISPDLTNPVLPLGAPSLCLYLERTSSRYDFPISYLPLLLCVLNSGFMLKCTQWSDWTSTKSILCNPIRCTYTFVFVFVFVLFFDTSPSSQRNLTRFQKKKKKRTKNTHTNLEKSAIQKVTIRRIEPRE